MTPRHSKNVQDLGQVSRVKTGDEP